MLLLPLAVTAQKKYNISGSITGFKQPATVYLAMVRNGRFEDVDSVALKNGKFQFQGSVTVPERAIVTLKRSQPVKGRSARDSFDFFLENSRIDISATDSIKNAKISGSVSDQENRELEGIISPLGHAIMQLNDDFRGKPKDAAYQKASDSVTHLVAEIKNQRWKFVESHLNSYMGLYVFSIDVLDSKFEPAVVEPLFLRFSAQLRNSDLGKKSLERIDVARRRQTGVKATDFTQNDLNGKAFTLSSLRGKYVLVDFWASWCGPCRVENPNLVKAYQALKDKNFEVVGVSLDQSKAGWEAAVKTDGLPWIHVSDLQGWKNAVAVMYGINSVPQNLLIDPQGMIIAKNLRGEALTQKLTELIK